MARSASDVYDHSVCVDDLPRCRTTHVPLTLGQLKVYIAEDLQVQGFIELRDSV